MSGAPADSSSKPSVCQVCGKPRTKTLSVAICDDHYQAGYNGLVDLILALREKEKPAVTPPPIPVPPTKPEQSVHTDKYGIHKLYPDSKTNRQHWYMDMSNPTQDPRFTNEENANLKKENDGAWSSDGADNGKYQVRLQGQILPKSTDVEITVYSNYMADAGPGIQDPGAYAYQVYRGGGKHSTTNPGLGAAYKARIRKDKSVVICKEVFHPAYSSNEGGIKKLTKEPKGNYIGVKLVVYNLPEQNGKVPVRIEAWCDEEGMNPQGVLSPEKQKWFLMAWYIDKGGWSVKADASQYGPLDMKNNAGGAKRQQDEILNLPGGDDKGNIGSYRTDGAKTKIKYFSIRVIQPYEEWS